MDVQTISHAAITAAEATTQGVDFIVCHPLWCCPWWLCPWPLP